MQGYLGLPNYVLTHLKDMELRGHTEGTIYARRRALVRMLLALPVPLLEAGPDELMAWRRSLAIGPDATVAYVSHARSFYGWAVDAGLIDRNPALVLPLPRTARRLPRPIPEESLMRAIAGAPDRIRPWLVLAGWCGLRAKEIAYLRRESVMETARPPVLIVAADATKGRSERTVPLCDYVLGELDAYGLPGRGYVFRRGDGQPGPNRPWLVSGLCNSYLHQAGIAESLHQLRHRFGTQAYSATRDLLAVQDLMGHAHPNTTAGYAAYNRESAIAAVRSLPAPRVSRYAKTGCDQ